MFSQILKKFSRLFKIFKIIKVTYNFQISSLQIRSTGAEINSEKKQNKTAKEAESEKEKEDTFAKEKANAAINPINEVSDDEFKEVIGSPDSLYNETTTHEAHKTKTRSPGN